MEKFEVALCVLANRCLLGGGNNLALHVVVHFAVDWKVTASTEDSIQLLQLNCPPRGVFKVQLDYVAQNPGDEFLSLSDVS
jgi:hypothetical protein